MLRALFKWIVREIQNIEEEGHGIFIVERERKMTQRA